jgi:hypothetical protein
MAMQDGIYRPASAIPINTLTALRIPSHPQPGKMFATATLLALANRAGSLKG